MRWLLLLCCCGETGPTRVRYPAFATGASGAFTAGDWQVTLDTARLTFGPAYFCATEAASLDLCPAAVNELAEIREFDALDEKPQPLGEVRGTAGRLRSVQYDLGVTWFAQKGAPAGHSAHFEGRAEKGDLSFRFVADVDIAPSHPGTLAVQGARVEADIQDSQTRLTVAVDPRRWWQRIDFDELSEGVVAPDSRAHSALVLGMTTTAAPTFTWSP